MKAGDKAIALAPSVWNHGFTVGSEIVFIGQDDNHFDFRGTLDGESYTQVLHPNEFKVIEQVQTGLKVGDRVVLVTNGGFVGDGFDPGTKGIIRAARRDAEGVEIYSVVLDSEPHGCGDYGWTFITGEIKLDTEVQTPPQKEKQVSTIQTEVKAPKVSAVLKTLYAVQDLAGSEVYIITEDRDEAREVKAAEGGKAYGVTIVQYKAVKEIR